MASVAADLGVSDQTIYTWRRQELVDTGVEAGLTTIEASELRTAKRKIKDLETELAVTRRANELLKEQVVSPKGGLSHNHGDGLRGSPSSDGVPGVGCV